MKFNINNCEWKIKEDLYYKTLLDVKEHCNNAKYVSEIINKALDDNE